MRKSILPTLTIGLMLVLFGRSGPAATGKPQEAQSPPRAGELQRQGERVFGTIASVGVDRFEIKKLDGASQIVKVDDQTRYRQGQQEVQLEDLKAGDRVVIRGRTNENNEFVALIARRLTQEEIARFQAAGERTFGVLVSIEKNQLKVRNRLQGERIVVVDEQTVYMKEGKPITLKDLKVGDLIVAVGKPSNGQFIAARVITGPFQALRGGPEPQREGASETH